MGVSEMHFFVGFQYTTRPWPARSATWSRLSPSAIAAALKIEAVQLSTLAGKAKVAGTLLCVGGSMIMPFYKGPLLKIPASPVHWRYAEHAAAAAAAPRASTGLGAALVILSAVAWAAWLVMQNKTSESFSAPYTSTKIMSLIVSVQCAGVSAAVDRSLSAWNLGLGIRLYSVLYMGIIGWGVTFAVMTWCIQVRGPLFVSMFNPVVLVVVAVLGWAILDEQLHAGSAIGSALIVGGLYMVLWGKGRQMSRPAIVDAKSKAEITNKGLEMKNDDADSSLPL